MEAKTLILIFMTIQQSTITAATTSSVLKKVLLTPWLCKLSTPVWHSLACNKASQSLPNALRGTETRLKSSDSRWTRH